MASNIMNKGAQSFLIDGKSVTLRIYPNGAGVPTFDHEGGVASVVLSATGKYLVTLTDSYYKVVKAFAQYQCSGDAVDLYAQLGDFANCNHNGVTVGTVGLPVTFVVKGKTGATNTDAAAATQTCIFVEVVFEDIAR
jgi:hypothetical protein